MIKPTVTGHMIKFSENELKQALNMLSHEAKTAFAAAAATRQLCTFERLAIALGMSNPNVLANVADAMWIDIQRSAFDLPHWKNQFDTVEHLYPNDGQVEWSSVSPADGWLMYAMADDAMKSGNIAVNPRSSRKQDIVELYHKAL